MSYENDIPLSVAHDAHRGTSMVPEKRAEQERANYAQRLTSDREMLGKLAATDEKRAILEEEFARYRGAYRRRYLDCLRAESRCMSSMITGPSNFPVARNQKRLDTADRRLSELLEFRERALKAIRRKLCPEKAPVMSGDADAVERLLVKIQKAEEHQGRMKKVNAAHKRYVKDPATLESSGLSEAEQKLVREYVPNYSFEKHPFQGWELTNNGANIRRMKQRVAGLQRTKAIPDSSFEGAAAKVEDCPADNRVRIFFPGKPDAEVRTKLKRSGFRWTPSMGCWQAYRKQWTLDVAREVAQVGGRNEG